MVALRLKDPPIVEVVCGFFFPALAGLDPILIGKYWAEHKEAHGYPKRQLQPPVADRPGFFLGDGVGPLRSWLVSGTDEYLLQIQPDRFYFNWRKREGAYPHFNDYEPTKGVLSRSLLELAALLPKELPSTQQRILDELHDVNVPLRYPDDLDEALAAYTYEEVTRIGKETEELLKWLKQTLN